MGDVYRAYDTSRDRYIALKLLPEAYSGDREYVKRFQRESNVAARLTEPHVIPIHDFGELDGQLFIDMRLVEGADIGALLDQNGRMAPERAVHLLGQVAEALDAAHADHLVHRDIKPSNILVTPRDFVYVVDFGIARSFGGQQTALTITGATIGTLHYMAPERFEGTVVDGRADIYSLACVLHECITGVPPFSGKDLPALLYAQLYSGPPAASSLAEGIPRALDAVIARGMAKDPKDRYPTAGQLAAAAREAMGIEASAPLMTQLPAPPWIPENQAPARNETQAPARNDTPASGWGEKRAPTWAETPPPPWVETPAPARNETPAPARNEAPAPAWNEAPAPAWNETPAPARNETPAPPRYETPAPARYETPAPARYENQAPPWGEIPDPPRPPATQYSGWQDVPAPQAPEAQPPGGRFTGSTQQGATQSVFGSGVDASWGDTLPPENVAPATRLDRVVPPPPRRPDPQPAPDPGPYRDEPGSGRRRIGLMVLAVLVALAVPIVVVLLVTNNKPNSSSPSSISTTQTSTVNSTGTPTNAPLQNLNSWVSGTVAVGENPTDIEVAPNGQFAYIVRTAAGVISVLNIATDLVSETIKIPGGPPQYVAFSPDSRTAYVSVQGRGFTPHIAFIDTATGTVSPTTVPVFNFVPSHLATSPDGKFLYVANHNTVTAEAADNEVDVINLATNTVTARVVVLATPHWVVFSKDGTRYFTTDHLGTTVTVVNAATNKVIQNIRVFETPHSEALSPDGGTLAVTSYSGNQVDLINTATNQVTKTIPVGQEPLDVAYSKDGRYIFTVNNVSNTLTVIDTATERAIGTIAVGKNPLAIAMAPNGSQAWVTDGNGGTIQIINIPKH